MGPRPRRWRWAAAPLAATLMGMALWSNPATSSAGASRTSASTAGLGGTSLLSVRRVPNWLESTLAGQRLSSKLASIAGSELVNAAQPAGCVMVSQRAEQLYSLNAHSEFIPASNLKLLTALAVLDRLGAGDRLTTSVVADRAPEHGVEYGNVYLVGGGDPLLRTASYAGTLNPPEPLYTSLNQLAQRLRDAGVSDITGVVVGDDSRYDHHRTVASWKPVYSTEGDVGPLSALDVNDGFVPKPPPPKTPPTTTPLTTTPATATTTTTVAPSTKGSAPQGATSNAQAFAFAAAADPPETAAEVFASLLRQDGVGQHSGAASGYAPPGAVPLATIQSAPLGDEVDAMLSVSDDTAAELFTKELGYQAAKAGTTAAGTSAIRADLASDGLPVSEMVNVDGSGLDRGDRASCNLLVAALTRAGPSGVLARGLPVAGQTGTLAKRFLGGPAVGRLRAKTGTLDEVVSLSGFVTPAPGAPTSALRQPVVFSIILNGLPGGQAQDLADRIGVALAGYPDVPSMAAVRPR